MPFAFLSLLLSLWCLCTFRDSRYGRNAGIWRCINPVNPRLQHTRTRTPSILLTGLILYLLADCQQAYILHHSKHINSYWLSPKHRKPSIILAWTYLIMSRDSEPLGPGTEGKGSLWGGFYLWIVEILMSCNKAATVKSDVDKRLADVGVHIVRKGKNNPWWANAP